MKVCHYLPGDMGGGGYSEIVTNDDMGEGRPKIAIFAVTSFLNGPYTISFMFRSYGAIVLKVCLQ